MTGCGCTETMGHGDYAVCGEMYYNEVHYCSRCASKIPKKTIADIETHLSMMLDDDLKKFCGYDDGDDLQMRIFRILNGFRDAYAGAMQLHFLSRRD